MRRVEGDDRIARALIRAGRNARDGQAGQEAAAPRRAVVGRHRVADVRRRSVDASADLEGRDRRPPEREAVRLDLGLVLRVRAPVRVAGEPAADELAVACDGVGQVRVDDVEPRSAPGGVARPVVRHRDEVAARAGVDRVATGTALEEVGAAASEELVVPREATDDVRARRPDEPVVPGRARHDARPGGSGGDQGEEDAEGDEAH